MLEPLPGGAIGLIGVTVVAVLSPYVLFSPAELAKPGFKAYNAAVTWALSGFSNTTVWLIFGAFMFALGYEKTGLGRRIALLLVKKMGRRTLTLGYAVAVADTILAPFTPSNTARSGGTIYPVIRNLPALYDSKPNDPSARRIGSYLMWVAIATTCVTSSMFLTGLAPNLLAIELVNKTAEGEPVVDAVVPGLRADRDRVADPHPAGDLLDLSAGSEGGRRGAEMGRRGAREDGRVHAARDHARRAGAARARHCGSSAATRSMRRPSRWS